MYFIKITTEEGKQLLRGIAGYCNKLQLLRMQCHSKGKTGAVMNICCGIVLFCPEKKLLRIFRILLNEMWMKCSGLSYFSLLISWAAVSSFCLLGINGSCILILFIWKRSSGVFRTSFYFFFFFSYLRTHEYSHPSVTSIIFAVHFCSNFFFFLASTPIIYDLTASQ